MKNNKNRYRDIQIKFCVTEEEKYVIKEKMKQVNIDNMGLYLRKMALTGKCVNYNFTPIFKELKEMNYHLSMMDNNVNQIAKRVNTTGSVYDEDMNYIREKIHEMQEYCKELMRNCLPSKYGE